ncbi:MAG: hypothetical protein VB957_06190 [Pseudomonadales bacterium]|jgi:hypothetical protein
MEKFCLIILISLIVACTSTQHSDDELARFVGRNIDEVIEELGRPSSRYNMQDGTWQYLWTTESGYSSGMGSSIMGIPISSQSRGECTIVLVIDSQKSVVDYSTEGRC